MKHSRICLLIMLELVIFCMIIPGCINSVPNDLVQNSSVKISDPETGITAWINAVNERDYGEVYNLMPFSKRAGISKDEYIKLNRKNPSPFLASGRIITDFDVLNKRVDGLNATITAGLITTGSNLDGNANNKQEMVFFTFEETFEENEWKVWTP